jgi:hypothetical protein
MKFHTLYVCNNKNYLPSLFSVLSVFGVPVCVLCSLRCPRSNTTILVLSDTKFSGMMICGAATSRFISHLFAYRFKIILSSVVSLYLPISYLLILYVYLFDAVFQSHTLKHCPMGGLNNFCQLGHIFLFNQQ